MELVLGGMAVGAADLTVVDTEVEVIVMATELEAMADQVTGLVEVAVVEVAVVEVAVVEVAVVVVVDIVKGDYNTYNEYSVCTMPLSISDGALEWQRLAVVNKHPRDDRIQFEEETHTYTIDGERKGWTSCTGFLHNFFGHFDADAVIAKMMASSKWYESKYFGLTAEQIKKQWSDKGAASSEAGTRMHLDIEHFYNAMPYAGAKEVYRMEDGFAGLAVDKWTPLAGAEWD